MKKGNYLLLGITALLLCIAGGAVGATFSRYQSTASATPTAQVAKWKVSVNDKSITESGETTLNDLDIVWDDSDYISEGVIAPGRTGHMDITINAQGSQVAAEYMISPTISENDNSKITISKVELDPEGTKTIISNSDGSYKGTIELAKIDIPIKVRIYIQWENDESNNEIDTQTGTSVDNINIPVTVTVSQKIAE